jgi:diguanylate cyclase (GGDEF)-like protein
MKLDLPTLMAVESFIAALSGLVILLGCPRGNDSRGSLWWAFGGVTTAAGLALLLYSIATNSIPLIITANLAIALSPAFYWTAARQLSRRDAIYALIPAGALLLALGSIIPGFRLAPAQQMALSLALNAAFFYAAAIALWNGRAERLLARWPLIGLLVIHATIFVAGATEALTGAIEVMSLAPLTSWFGLMHFESIVFSVGTAVFVVAFTRERAEARQRMVAEIDPMTGMSTRRALLEQAERALHRCQAADAPLSLVIFDLDHFKSINDRFGHPVGDAVLRRFGDTVRATLRQNDSVGRIGGEEFALLLPDTNLVTALEIAERVRAGFEADGRVLDSREIAATVSAGVTTAHRDSTVPSMLRAADEGLYEAKARGRNRVERPPARNGRDGKGLLNRVA